MTRSAAQPASSPERRYPITVELTAREIAALVGEARRPVPVAVCVTSADDEDHRVNYATGGIKAFLAAVQQQRP